MQINIHVHIPAHILTQADFPSFRSIGRVLDLQWVMTVYATHDDICEDWVQTDKNRSRMKRTPLKSLFSEQPVAPASTMDTFWSVYLRAADTITGCASFLRFLYLQLNRALRLALRDCQRRRGEILLNGFLRQSEGLYLNRRFEQFYWLRQRNIT